METIIVTSKMNAALESMDTMFTSREFYDVYRNIGGTQNHIHSGALRTYLCSVANQAEGSKKLWIKKTESVELPKPESIKEPSIVQKHFDQPLNHLTEQDCIKFLKARGYTITKIVEF